MAYHVSFKRRRPPRQDQRRGPLKRVTVGRLGVAGPFVHAIVAADGDVIDLCIERHRSSLINH